MGNHQSDALLGPINRRTLMGKGAALVGGAAAGLALKPEAVLGQEKPAQPAPKAAAPAEPVNLHPPVVQVKGGKLRGIREGKVNSFLGIRYAEAERFGLPKPVQPWDGIKNAQAWGPVCPIPPMTAVGVDEFVFPHRYWVENENCQVLNVWTQNIKPAVKKPVMVWMHGGGFTNGSSMESVRLRRQDALRVRRRGGGQREPPPEHHRDARSVGVRAAYANSRYTGTADLVAALQWVHDNIEAFGGDPGNVLIFGQSGGGGKVVRMMHTPAAKGLFHKVVAQSGGSNNYRDTDPAESIKDAAGGGRRDAEAAGAHGSDIDKLKTGAVPRAARRRHRRLAGGRQGTRRAAVRLECHRGRQVRDARVLRLGRHDPAHGGRRLQRADRHAAPGRRTQERVDARRRSTISSPPRSATRRTTSSPSSRRRSRGRRSRTCSTTRGLRGPASSGCSPASSRRARRPSTTTCSRTSTR